MKAIKRYTRYDIAERPEQYFYKAYIAKKPDQGHTDPVYILSARKAAVNALVDSIAAGMFNTLSRQWKDASGVEKIHWRTLAVRGLKAVGISSRTPI